MIKFERDIIYTELSLFMSELKTIKHPIYEDKLLNKYTERIMLSFTHDCEDFYTKSEMLDLINHDKANPFNGFGYWLDKNLNILGNIFETDAVPENAVWADWYNK